MKKRMVFGALLLTLGTAAAAAGSFLYGNAPRAGAVQITLPSDREPVAQEITPETIAMWKATAASVDSASQKAPI